MDNNKHNEAMQTLGLKVREQELEQSILITERHKKSIILDDVQIATKNFDLVERRGTETRAITALGHHLEVNDASAKNWHESLSETMVEEGCDPEVALKAATRFIKDRFSADYPRLEE